MRIISIFFVSCQKSGKFRNGVVYKYRSCIASLFEISSFSKILLKLNSYGQRISLGGRGASHLFSDELVRLALINFEIVG